MPRFECFFILIFSLQIFAYVILLSYVMDLVFRYYEYRTKSPPDFKAKNPLESAFDPPQQKFGYA
jgi:hypothetical protein